jgi:hypothetical protein
MMPMQESQDSGAVAKIVAVQFGRVDGVFGLHIRLAFPSNQVNDYTVTDMAEIEELMDSFKAQGLADLLNKRMRIRRYPLPLGSFSVVG